MVSAADGVAPMSVIGNKADMTMRLVDVRFWEQSGHRVDMCRRRGTVTLETVIAGLTGKGDTA
jgi:hypothetical protein